MHSWLKIGIVLAVLAVALPAPLRADDKKAEDEAHPRADAHGKAGHGLDHHDVERMARAWSQLSEQDRQRFLDDLTRNMTNAKDKRATKEFFERLAIDYKEKNKTLGVESGLFKGAIEVSLWTILVFLLLLSVLGKFAWGPIMEGLNKREQSIARDRHEADAARREASDMRVRLDAELARANDEIRQMMDKARQDAQKTAAEELARGKADLQAERQKMFHDVGVARDNALKEIWTQAAEVATLISAKAIRKHLTPDDHRALLDEALKEFRGSAQERKDQREEDRA
jgi:F-type H+-transporting ATPase subunit b